MSLLLVDQCSIANSNTRANGPCRGGYSTLVFGYDFFVSYAWSDGQLYALLLVVWRPNNSRCFLIATTTRPVTITPVLL